MKFSFVLLAASAILFSSVSAGLIEVKDTNVEVKKVAHKIANDLDAGHALQNANVDVVSHAVSEGGDHIHNDD
jgi:ribosomal protein S3